MNAVMIRLGDRSLFPRLEPRAYLNHAAISPPSTAVCEVIEEVIGSYARLGVGAHRRWLEQRGRLRAKLAGLIGARAEDIAFVANTTRGVSDVALCFPWRRGDRVVLVQGEFPANTTPWQRAAELHGLEIAWLPPLRDTSWLDEVERVVSAPRARLLAVSAVQFQTGLAMPLADLGEACARHGTQLFVDGIQACGIVPIDVSASRIDYLSCGSHKWLMGTEGAAFLYVAPERAPELRPHVAGWMSHERPLSFLFEGPGLLRYDRPIRRSADVVEGGMPNTLGLAALEAAIDPILELSVPAIAAHVARYHDALEPALVARGFESRRDRTRPSGILSFEVPEGIDVIALHRAIDPARVSCSTPDGLLRFAPHWPNALDEVPAVVDAIDEAVKRARAGRA